MPRMKIFAAALAALLLCGCSNDTSSAPEVTSATESTLPTTEALSSATVEQGQAPGGIPADTGTPAAPGGVDLVSGDYSDNSLIFDLNGTYCDVSGLPFTVETFKPELSVEKGYLLDVRDGKLIFQGWNENDLPDQNNWSIFTYDLRTEELTEVFNAMAAMPDAEGCSPIYANDEYVVVCAYPDDRNTYRVFRYGRNDPVFTLPKSDENNVYISSGSMYIVYDQLYFDGECRLSGFDQSIPAIFRTYLSDGKTDVFALNAGYPRYGVGNVCFSIRTNDTIGKYLSDLRGDIYPSWDEISRTSTILDDTYYPIRTRYIEDKILGGRTTVSWLDKSPTLHEIGTTGFGYGTSGAHITIDGIFMIPLYHENSSSVNKLLVGMYDKYADANRAALIPCEDRSVFAENTALYYVDRETLETTMICPYDEEVILLEESIDN